MADIYGVAPIMEQAKDDDLLLSAINVELQKQDQASKAVLFPYVDHTDPLKMIMSFYQQPIKKIRGEGLYNFPIEARYGFTEDKQSLFLDVGSILGQQTVPPIARAPLMSSSKEVGRILKKVVAKETKTIVFLNVQSIAADLGLGMLQELGIQFFNQYGQPFDLTSGKLGQISSFSYEQIQQRWLDYEYLILESDRDMGQLLGGEGVAVRNQKQTGASPEIVKVLDREAAKVVELLEGLLAKPIQQLPEASVGNGFAFGCLQLLRKVQVQNQVTAFMELTDFEKTLEEVDYFVTPARYEAFRQLLQRREIATLVIKDQRELITSSNELAVTLPTLVTKNFPEIRRELETLFKILYFRKN